MQRRNEQIIKIAKDLSFINAKAFKPSTSAVVTFFPFNFGGVFGSEKEYKPSKIETAAPISNGKDVMEIEDHSSGGMDPPRNAGQIERNSFSKKKLLPTNIPDAIQPIVPRVRMGGNCLCGSSIFWKHKEFDSARVGM